MGTFKVITKPDAEQEYLLNCFRYIIGGHTIPECYGGINVCPERAYQQMMAVKQYYGKTTGNQLVHFVITLDHRVFDELDALLLADRIAGYYGNRYQIIYGVHRSHRNNRYGLIASYLHIHMIMNSVSFVDGKMYADNKGDTQRFLEHIKKVTGDYHWKIVYGH